MQLGMGVSIWKHLNTVNFYSKGGRWKKTKQLRLIERGLQLSNLAANAAWLGKTQEAQAYLDKGAKISNKSMKRLLRDAAKNRD